AVGAELERELDVVVDDDRYAEFASEPYHRLRLRTVDGLAAVLEKCDAAFQREAHFSFDVAAFRRDGIEPAQLHRRKKRFGRSCPPPGLKPAASASQVKCCASRAASAGSRPCARRAAIAEASVQPEPW